MSNRGIDRHAKNFHAAFMGIATWLACDMPEKSVDPELDAMGEPWLPKVPEIGPLMRFIRPYIDTAPIRAVLEIEDDHPDRKVWFEAFCERLGDDYYREVERDRSHSLGIDNGLYEQNPAGFGLWVFLAVIIDLVTIRVASDLQQSQSMDDIHVGNQIRLTAIAILTSRFKIQALPELSGFTLRAPISLRFLAN